MQAKIKQLRFCRGHMNSNVFMLSLKDQQTSSGQLRLICMKLSLSPKLTAFPFIKT